MTTPGSPAARELIRQLFERETAGATEEAGLGAAIQRAYAHVSGNLRRSIGEDGYRALLDRALARTQPEQAVLMVLRRTDAGSVHLDIAAGVDGHGVGVIGAALETLLAALVDILSDLVGTDMVRSLLAHDAPP
jgi:hypothetical protein